MIMVASSVVWTIMMLNYISSHAGQHPQHVNIMMKLVKTQIDTLCQWIRMFKSGT